VRRGADLHVNDDAEYRRAEGWFAGRGLRLQSLLRRNLGALASSARLCLGTATVVPCRFASRRSTRFEDCGALLCRPGES